MRLTHHEPLDLTYLNFVNVFDKRYFSSEVLHQKKNAFEHLRHNTRTKEYELDFTRLRRFAGSGMDEEDLIMTFLNGIRVDLRGRCSMVT